MHAPSLLSPAALAPAAVRAAAARAQPSRRPDLVVRAQQVVRVCTNKDCRRKGSNKTLELMQALAPPELVAVEEVDCLSECGIGPNIEVLPGGEADAPGKVVNGCKTEEDVAKLLAGYFEGCEGLLDTEP
mmetsp:Transcript_20154/g.64135  ORF Transcript_20154/g.64135 Transcript_20154/m.64135 type:complete len:130 (+) Transcript_20154:1000-1389(+)